MPVRCVNRNYISCAKYDIYVRFCQGGVSMIYQKLGEKIRKLRKGQALSQEDLAEFIKLDVRTVVAIEAGKRNPTLKTIHKIARALKVPVYELLKF